MKKFILTLAAKIVGLAVACAAVVLIYNSLHEIGNFFVTAWAWATSQWFYFLPTFIVLGLVGLEIKKLKAINVLGDDSWYYCLASDKQEKIAKITSKILLLVGSIGADFSLLLLFNFLGWIKLGLIIFGAIIVALGPFFLTFHLFRKKIIKDKAAVMITVIHFLFLLYYLDIFIFSWKPWITLVIVLITLTIYLVSKSIKKIQKIKKEKAEKLQQENEQKTIENLSLLEPTRLAENYLTARQKGEELTAKLNLSALSLALNRGRNLNPDNLTKICKTIQFLTCSLDKEFFNLIIIRCFESGYPIFNLIFTTRSSCAPFDVLPVLFANCSYKEAVIEKYLSGGLYGGPMGFEKSACYNSVKREFKIPVFIGIMNILFFAYDKNEDEAILNVIFEKIEKLMIFANDCLPKMYDKSDVEKLKTVITNLAKKAKTKGIIIEELKKPELFE